MRCVTGGLWQGDNLHQVDNDQWIVASLPPGSARWPSAEFNQDLARAVPVRPMPVHVDVITSYTRTGALCRG
jgi:hypothetical protein